MITIKLPYTPSNNFFSYLEMLQKQQSNVIRYSFNRFQDGLNEKEIREKIKSLKNISTDSWINQSAIKEASQLYSKFKDQKIIFGSKINLKNYLKGIVSKNEYKLKKLSPLSIQGEAPQKGNRKFTLDLIDNRQIIFKINKSTHFNLKLPKLRANLQKQLFWLEEQSKQKKMPFSVKLTKEFICISFEEMKLEKIELFGNRVFSIDLNPNSIGYSISEYKNEEQSVIDSGIVEIKKLNTKLNKSSDSNEQIYQNNKREHELLEVSKFLIEKAIHYKCSKFIVEDLTIKNMNHLKGKTFNRLVNNSWNRELIITNLKKRCRIFGLNFIEVNPVYSSIIGNTVYKKYPDPISASLEINRRGQFKYQKGKFYPKIPDYNYLNELWKQTLGNCFESWKELSIWLKNSKLRYRIPLDENLKSFSYRSPKSTIYLYDVGCL